MSGKYMDLNRLLSKSWIRAGLSVALACSLLGSLLGGCILPISGAPPVTEDNPPTNQATTDNAFDVPIAKGGENYYYLLGQILLRERNWSEAEKAMTEVAKLDPLSVESRLLVSHLATQRGDLKKAILFAEEVIALEPEDEKARLLLAGLFAATKSHQKAIKQYKKVITINPKNLLPRLQLAQLYGHTKDSVSAKKVLAPLFKNPVIAWKAYLAMGRAYVNFPNMKKAVTQFRKAYQLEPNRLETVLALGAALQKIKHPKEAEEIYREYLATHPNSKEVHGRLGRLFLNQDNQKAALTEFQAVSQISPNSVPARLTSALILLSQGRFEDALHELRLAEATAPEDGNIHYYLGQVLESLDRFKEAEAAYRKVKETESFYAEAQLRLAFLETEAGHRPEGIQRITTILDRENKQVATPDSLKKRVTFILALNVLLMQDENYLAVVDTATSGLALEPKHGRLRFNRAMALDKLGRWPEAEKDLLTYIEQYPNDANALNYLGYTWADRNQNLEEALKLLQRSILLSPGDGFITDSLGWVLYRLNRLDEALAHMREAVRLEPEDAAIQEHLGDVLHALGQKAEAMSVWKKALELAPDNLSLQKKIQP